MLAPLHRHIITRAIVSRVRDHAAVIIRDDAIGVDDGPRVAWH